MNKNHSVEESHNFSISRLNQLVDKLIIVNGFPGCGKTMLSPILSSFQRVEIMQYNNVLEQMCELHYLAKITDDVASSMIKTHLDESLYNISIGRNSNCRPSDLSSIFKNKPLIHIKRMLEKGDEKIFSILEKRQPILHIAAHMLLPSFNLLNSTFGKKLIFYEVIRHPIYMLTQNERNFKTFETARHGHVRYSFGKKEYTFFTKGWEKEFDNANDLEKSVHLMNWYFKFIKNEINHKDIKFIPFEKFVKNPQEYLESISKEISSPIDYAVRKSMKNQKVPRKLLNNAPALDIYKRCGWEPPKYPSDELELKARREVVTKKISPSSLKILDNLSNFYIDEILSNKI